MSGKFNLKFVSNQPKLMAKSKLKKFQRRATKIKAKNQNDQMLSIKSSEIWVMEFDKNHLV